MGPRPQRARRAQGGLWIPAFAGKRMAVAPIAVFRGLTVSYQFVMPPSLRVR